jgi:hypothetical protein
MTQYKTILASNAPWPTYAEPVKKAKRVMPKPSPSKGKLVDANFDRWLSTLKPIKSLN